MTEKIKVMTVVGTRPEVIRLSEILKKLDDYCHHILVHTGQNYDYELNQIFFDQLKLRKPDYYLGAARETSSKTIGNIIIEVDSLLEELKPDAVMVLGDTNSCLALLPAKKRKIPTFHLEAGNRCFDQRVPEEINRKIVDHLADINLTYSAIAREYLLREGVRPEMVIKVGSPMFEVLQASRDEIDKSIILKTLELNEKEYFVFSAHREENIESIVNIKKLQEIINSIALKYGRIIVMPLHPRTRKKFEELKLEFNDHVKFIKPLGFYDYNKLQKNALAVLSDSGTISEEAIIQNFPALNIRENHERPEAMEGEPIMMGGLSPPRVMQVLDALIQMGGNNHKYSSSSVLDYCVPNVSDKVIKIIISYIDYVNTYIWKK